MEGSFVGATLIDNVKPGMSVYENEIFGPVLSFVRAKTYEDNMNITHSHKLGNGASKPYLRVMEELLKNGLMKYKLAP